MLHSETGNGPGAQNPDVRHSAYRDWREERRAWRQERREARHRFSFHGLFLGLTLVLLGTLFLLDRLGVITGGLWWQSLLIGLGVISIIDGFAHYVNAEYRWGAYGKFVSGLILIAVGVLFVLGLSQWWPLALIIAGVALLLRFIWRR